jgi:hypothetical protein
MKRLNSLPVNALEGICHGLEVCYWRHHRDVYTHKQATVNTVLVAEPYFMIFFMKPDNGQSVITWRCF